MFRPNTPDLSDSDVFYVERSSAKQTPLKRDNSNVRNATELSGVHVGDLIKISPVTSPEPNILTVESDTNEPTIPYSYGTQDPQSRPV